MESGCGQCRPTAPARVVRFSVAPEKARYHSEKGDSSILAGFTPRQTAFPVLPQTSADRLREAREKLLELEIQQQSKEVELVHLKALLDKKAALEKGRTLEIYELKNRLEEEEHRRKEAELRFAEMNIEAKNYRAATEDLLKELERCCSLKDTLMEEMRPLGEYSIPFPNILDEAKENLKEALLKKKALKCKVSDLTAELEGCRKELDTKSKQYQDAVGSMVALQEKFQELQQRVQDLSAENAECQDKTNILEQEHASVLSHRDSLDQHLKAEQEEKALLEACLRKLAGSLCSHLDLENRSTLAVIEALGSALQQLLLENSSLRDKQVLNDSIVKELTTEKALLLAEKEALADKFKGFDELHEIKLRLEDELLVERHANAEMMQNFRDCQLKTVDFLHQLEQEHAEAVSSLDMGAQEILSGYVGLRADLSKHLFDWRHQANRMSELNDECVQKDMELQRLNIEAANSASTIRDLKDENKRLYEGVTNFEQLALQSADDLDQAQSEIASLKEALAMAQMEALPVEEREKAALLLIEKESQISFLEEKLKEMESAMAKLNQEMIEACKIADVLRDANEGLKNALLSRDKELEENRVDHDAQTEEAETVDTNVQTDDTIKVDCDVQTTETGDEIISKLASTQRDLNQLCLSFQQLSHEKAALEKSYKRCESKISEEQRSRMALAAEVEELRGKVAMKSSEVNQQRRMINSLQASLQQSQQKIQKASHVTDQASALRTQNEQLKSEMSKLKKKVQDLMGELNTVKEMEAMKLKHVEQLYKQSQEEIQFLKKASCDTAPGAMQVTTPVAQESTVASAAEQAVDPGRPLIRDAVFTPESTQTPMKPSLPMTTALATPPTVVELSSDDSSQVSVTTPVAQESSVASAAEQAVDPGRPLIREAVFTPESTQMPMKPSLPMTAALATPPCVVQVPSDDSPQVFVTTLVAQESTVVSAAEQAVDPGHPLIREAVFTPESTQTPMKPSLPMTAELATPPCMVQVPSDDSPQVLVTTTMAQESSTASAAEQAAGHGRPLIREAMFIPESTQTPTKPSFPMAAVLATPLSVVEVPSGDCYEMSLLKLVQQEQVALKTSRDGQPKESDTGASTKEEARTGEHSGAAEAPQQQPVEEPLTKTRKRGKKAAASVTPCQQKSEKSRRSKASAEASPSKAPTAKRRKFLRSEDDDTDEFKTSLV